MPSIELLPGRLGPSASDVLIGPGQVLVSDVRKHPIVGRGGVGALQPTRLELPMTDGD